MTLEIYLYWLCQYSRRILTEVFNIFLNCSYFRSQHQAQQRKCTILLRQKILMAALPQVRDLPVVRSLNLNLCLHQDLQDLPGHLCLHQDTKKTLLLQMKSGMAQTHFLLTLCQLSFRRICLSSTSIPLLVCMKGKLWNLSTVNCTPWSFMTVLWGVKALASNEMRGLLQVTDTLYSRKKY